MTLIETFEAVDDAGGRYMVEVYGTGVPHRPVTGGKSAPIGRWTYQLDTGEHVNTTSDPAVFKILDTDVKILRV